ncbi:T-cell-specific guanine nucleotide triphosphate-binding protein 2-like [Branchiostoma lanceolatum]|uniref:T-cell-specific guanine nucleotide triphosphate-binding protein 2-like n=1 Tax=Branchiostoma lanceolatum TaxID=7740 RepID=UPI0034517613
MMADRGDAPTEEIIGEMNEEEQAMLKNLASAGGANKVEILKKIQKYAAENMEAWKNQKVNVGIVGDPGAGKSTFINSIRGLKPKAHGAAEVGVTHTTAEATDYPHPARPDSLVFVDFPGVLLERGSGDGRDFDIQQYVAKFEEKMQKCHVFLVFSSGRIQHNAVQIGMKARDMGKTVLFVRSQFDKDLADKKNDDPEYFDDKTEAEAEADLMEELRQDYIKVLKRVGWEGEVNRRDVFIISGRLNYVLKGSWDIPKFRKAMIDGLGALQKMVVINTCRDFSKATIKERGDIYRSKVWTVAMAATTGSLVPYAGMAAIPGALAVAYKQYKEGFGLTEDAVEQLAKMTNKSPEDLKQFLSTNLLTGARGPIGENEALAVVQAICNGLGLLTAAAVDQTIDFIFPVIGALVTAPLAYGITTKVLHALISRMEKCAGELFDYAFKESAV